MSSKGITLNSRVFEFNDNFYKDSDKLMYRFCYRSINYTIHSKIIAHIESKDHKKKKATVEHTNNSSQQLILTTTIKAAESRKENVREEDAIPAADTLQREYLSIVFKKSITDLKNFFKNKKVSI
ncbi:6634_t:CDS:2 [Scutellospora calospora]|uniref:6634_t:CDS:1 n=1 Tax=Scutellospora calospora TaxID=85575 RepID=A0ACA9LYP2_9GLOM|nr:6634_t:CDS:2 [Scutellospora calospora]